MRERMKKAIEDHFPLPTEIRQLRNNCIQDLWFGPLPAGPDDDGKDYPGFVTATNRLSEWAQDTLSEVWVNEESEEVTTREPSDREICYECQGNPCDNADEDAEEDGICEVCGGTGYVETGEAWMHYERGDVARIIFGRELADYVR